MSIFTLCSNRGCAAQQRDMMVASIIQLLICVLELVLLYWIAKFTTALNIKFQFGGSTSKASKQFNNQLPAP